MRIPIFPLQVVLFPGVVLPLHIFEPRYREMVARCLSEHSPFGVVLAREDGIAPVGCTAEISDVVKRYPDGKMDILTVGRSIFGIQEVFDDNPLLEAEVEHVTPETEAPAPGDVQRLLRLFEECYQLVAGKPASLPEAASNIPLSYYVASELPLDLDYKQELLETQSEAARVNDLTGKLEKWLPQLQQMRHARRVAGGNGKALH